MCVLVAQSCPSLCDPMDCSSPGSAVLGFSRQEYWSRLPTPGDFPVPGIKPMSLESPASAAGFFTTEPPGSDICLYTCHIIDEMFALSWSLSWFIVTWKSFSGSRLMPVEGLFSEIRCFTGF